MIEDWGQLISFEPGVVLRPASVDELKRLLEKVHLGELGKGRVRVPGSLHSCAKIVVADTLLDTSGLPKSMEFEDAGGAVVATANVTLHELLAEASVHGKSITATGGADMQTLAGVISTATAPASSRHLVYDLLDWVELVSVDGATGKAVERRISRGDSDFAAAVCSLGVLGVLTRVRFRLVNELFFTVVQKLVKLDDVLLDLDATSAKYDFWRVDWLPKSKNALLWAATAIPSGQSKPNGDYPPDEAEQLLESVFKALAKKGSETGPLLNGTLEKAYNLLTESYKESHVTGPLRNMLPVDRRAPLHVAMAEWSFRPADLKRVLDECEAYFGDHGWPNIPTEIELTRVDDVLMSPWNWEGLPYIAKINFMYATEVCTKSGEKEAIYTHLRGLWDRLKVAGVPFKAHWGKINFIDPEFVLRNHHFDAFCPLISPMLMNDYLAERFGLIGSVSGAAK